ncbi:DUF4239 domain-containing protein [Legionella cardiaca]|uniref:DUF4239 domain-containing protein n=1 Tax=Legionella cardiaca TaxID=1071983 RepID=A0ABY8ARY9_9GAMM|nr:DUF4239 domain-containing protein [Legionella cardiaca]WED43288.1 DUF4239 domain-containing protein [Legionella cardiaca]
MFRELINTFSVLQIFLLILVLLTAFSALASYLASILIPKETVNSEYSRSTDNILSIMGSGYGVFLGFVIIALWNQYLAVQRIVYQEADALSIIVRNIEVFPEEDRSILKNAVYRYLEAIRVDEWQTMRQGKESEKAWAATYNLYKTFQTYDPKTQKQALFYRQIINNIDATLKDRRNRLISMKSILTDEMRTALILGAMVIIFLSSLLKAREGALRIFATFCLATVISFNLTLALSFDYPFSGSISVSNAAFYEGVLAN